MVTVTEIDLARKRIALSMRSNPVIGPKAPLGQGGPRSPGGPGQAGRGAPGPSRSSAPTAPQSLNGDWFTTALNKKK
jgi:uncharacterized protein